jgi:hypothetical protein
MVFQRPTGDSSAAARGEIIMSRITVIMILEKRLLIVLMSTSGKVGGAASLLLPVAEAVFDIVTRLTSMMPKKARSTMATKADAISRALALRLTKWPRPFET